MVDALLGPRDPKPVRDGSCAQVHPVTISSRQHLDVLRVHTIDLAARVLAVDNGNLYATDFLVTTMLQRTCPDV